MHTAARVRQGAIRHRWAPLEEAESGGKWRRNASRGGGVQGARSDLPVSRRPVLALGHRNFVPDEGPVLKLHIAGGPGSITLELAFFANLGREGIALAL